ncbi:MAG: hypothetical protein F4231_07885 [Acidimicrobiaceae bacterium]|nr:hypothetical protein [Acidimicrobiaceae bacterium]
MPWDLEAGDRVTDFRELPTPGAVQYWEDEWAPTLDGEPILRCYPLSRFATREEACAEAIKHVKHRAGLAFEVRIGSRSGCCMIGDTPVIVETVAEAREVIVSHAKEHSRESRSELDDEEHFHFRTRRGRPAWKSLLECETSRRYDPAAAEAGMSCSYLQMCKSAWTYSVEIWATGPPEIWDHPADQPAGLDNEDGLYNNPRPNSASNDPSELEDG